MNNHCVILTCTVKPKKSVSVLRNDPSERLKDYVEAINKWYQLLENLKIKILVLENSGSMKLLMSQLPEHVCNNVMFHQCSMDQISAGTGISSGEFQMLKESMKLLQKDKQIDYCWKVTGRLFVSNFEKIANPNENEILVNRFYKPRHIVDSRFFGMPTDTFSKVFSQRVKFNENDSLTGNLKLSNYIFPTMEDFLTQISITLERKGFTVKSFDKIPVFEGFSASTGKRLDTWKSNCKIKIANSFRKYGIKIISGSLP